MSEPEKKAPRTHSPLPWATEAFNRVDFGAPDYSAMIISGDGESIIAQQMSDDDADLTVRCVNACEGIDDPSVVGELVEALEGVEAALSDVAGLVEAEFRDQWREQDKRDEAVRAYRSKVSSLLTKVRGQ